MKPVIVADNRSLFVENRETPLKYPAREGTSPDARVIQEEWTFLSNVQPQRSASAGSDVLMNRCSFPTLRIALSTLLGEDTLLIPQGNTPGTHSGIGIQLNDEDYFAMKRCIQRRGTNVLNPGTECFRVVVLIVSFGN